MATDTSRVVPSDSGGGGTGAPSAARARKGSILWPGMVFILIGISFTICGITVFVTIGDPTFGVEENYYAKAIAWDDTARQRQLNNELGWVPVLTLSEKLDPRGLRRLTLDIKGSDGSPVDADLVDAVLFHHARRNEVVEVRLFERGGGVGGVSPRPGHYEIASVLSREGVWQVRLKVMAGGKMFTHTADIETDIATGGEAVSDAPGGGA